MFRILHLSDLHARPATNWASHPVLATARDAILSVGDEVPIDIVAFTGDIAFSGKTDEYEIAHNWIDETCLSSAGLNLPTDRILFVPGNHDVDRSKIDVSSTSLERTLQAAQRQEDVANIYMDEKARETLFSRLHAYSEFVRTLTGRHELCDPSWSACFPHLDRTIQLVGYTTSWLSCGNNDPRRLLIGQPQLTESIGQGGSAEVTVALMHHPLADLMHFDEQTCDEYFRANAQLLLRGHLHRRDAVQHTDTQGGYLEIAAGALYEDDASRNYFNIIDIDDEATQVTVATYCRERGRWIRDRNAYPDSVEGVGKFTLSARSIADKSSSSSGPRGLLSRPTSLDGSPEPDVFVKQTKSPESGEATETESVLDDFPRFQQQSRPQDLAIRAEQLTEAHWSATTRRRVLLVAEWGVGVESFLSAAISRLCDAAATIPVLHARCSGAEDGPAIQEILEQYADCSMPDFCVYVREMGRCVLVLDDVLFADGQSSTSVSAVLDLCTGSA